MTKASNAGKPAQPGRTGAKAGASLALASAGLDEVWRSANAGSITLTYIGLKSIEPSGRPGPGRARHSRALIATPSRMIAALRTPLETQEVGR